MLCINRCVTKNIVKSLYSLRVTVCYKRKRMNLIHYGKLRGVYTGSGVATCFEVILFQKISIAPEYPSGPFSGTARSLRQG